MKILLPVDGSDYTRHVLSFLVAHRDSWASGHALTVLHAVPAVSPRAAELLGPHLVGSHYEQCARAVLDPVRSRLAHEGIKAEFVDRIGDPATEIASCAEAGKFDLLIMGSHGEGALKNLLLGSVASKVLARSTLPVLLVRSGGHDAATADAPPATPTPRTG